MSNYMGFFLIVVYVHYHFGLFLCGIWCNKLSEMNIKWCLVSYFLKLTSEIAVLGVVAEI